MNMFDDVNGEIREFLKSLIRVGRVSTVNYQKGTARVVFPDDDDVVSYELPVLHRNAIKNKDYNMPDIDERVLCLFLPSGVASGFILGSIYTDVVLPPESSGKYRTVVFDDGTRVRYDRGTHQLSVEISALANRNGKAATAPIRFTLAQRMTMEYIIPAGFTIKAGDLYFATTKELVINPGSVSGDVLAQCTEIGEKGNGFVAGAINVANPLPGVISAKNIDESSGGEDQYDSEPTQIIANRQSVTISTPASVSVNTPDIALNGDVTVSGTVTAKGDVVGAGISLSTHKHTGNQGAPTSAPI